MPDTSPTAGTETAGAAALDVVGSGAGVEVGETVVGFGVLTAATTVTGLALEDDELESVEVASGAETSSVSQSPSSSLPSSVESVDDALAVGDAELNVGSADVAVPLTLRLALVGATTCCGNRRDLKRK